MTWDGEVVTQSERLDAYRDSLTRLRDRTYECFCTRKEIEQAVSAPHGEGHRPYPGTCARLSAAERARRRQQRPAAIRIRAEGARFTVTARFAGEVTGVVDDFVLIRGDGVPAYNFAAVVDDLHQGVNRITRGADLLDSAPRQAWLATLLGGRPPSYAHIGLVTNPAGRRLAKRDGAVTLADLLDQGWRIPEVLAELTASLGLGRHETPEGALAVMPEPLPDTFCAPVTWTGNGFASSATTLP